MRHSSKEAHPTLGLPVLAEVSGEQVDAASLTYFRGEAKMQEDWKARQAKKQEEQRQAEEDPDGWQQAIGSDGVQYFWHRRTRRAVWALPSSASTKARKKRKKKKLP